MRKLSNITGIILFIVIAFCSCKEKKEIDQDKLRAIYLADSIEFTSGRSIPKNDTLSIRQIVAQSDNIYVLCTTIETQGYRDYLETSHMFPLSLSDMPKPLYQKWISGSFRFIADNKKRQYAIADSMLSSISVEYYKKLEEIKIIMAQQKLMADSVKLLNSLK